MIGERKFESGDLPETRLGRARDALTRLRYAPNI